MFGALKPQPADKILKLMQAFREDPRGDKIDLGVGVYRNAEGVTPVMRAVKEAEKQLWELETTKAYTGLVGDPGYQQAMADLVIADTVDRDRVAAAHTPGGTGAIRQSLELIRMAAPKATVWLSAPTWPNHPSILKYLKMPMAEYRYFDKTSCTVDFEGMMADLEKVKPGDVVLLHGCCHNPTGANLRGPEWEQVADLLLEKDAIPFVDIAYQGFGDGLRDDAAGVRLLASRMPEMLIAASCSKNFGIYRERTGIVLAIAPDAKTRDVTQGNLAYLNRQNFSFPPDHGARLVTMILTNEALRREWKDELEKVRRGMLELRMQLAEALRDMTGSDRFGFIADHRGMFSMLGATPEQVEKMRADSGIYMVGDSRINIAGLNSNTVPKLAEAMVKAGV
ncbi:aromatic amino acid aminotransferase [Maritimibacter sp. 55A14]|uniref:amino acid aminotransferase n=1 Tax=Maritimibacter sp. 55A14 TaxID=2174844 RepID=UPI000D61822F|nr:amino acid aminotransferase [Maritimibacter sp. 55A14]PWE32391.1 aromatic amino acid aminotransferase [Maritimibacter sp. 55A14]